jgi:septal ring factor EnvC (AmiA/AmiB activator)
MLRRIVVIPLVLVAALAAGGAAPAPQAARLRRTADNPDLRQVESDTASREQDLSKVEAEAAAARLQAAQLQAQLAELNAAQADGERSISEKRLKLASLSAEAGVLNARLGGDQAELAHLLSALELFRRDPPPALLTKPEEVRDAVRAQILIRAITPQLERRAEALKAQAHALQALHNQIEASAADIRLSQGAMNRRRAEIARLIAQQQRVQDQAEAQAAAAEADIETLEARARALRDLANGVTGRRGPASAATAPPPDPEHAGLFGHPRLFTSPAKGDPIRRFNELETGGRSRSNGWTWRTATNSAVLAPAQGVVEYAGPLKGWGLVLILRLGGGYDLVLAGLDSVTVGPGHMVDAGQPVGRMGASGEAGTDLYFEIRKNGAPVDPARWLKAPPPGGR